MRRMFRSSDFLVKCLLTDQVVGALKKQTTIRGNYLFS